MHRFANLLESLVLAPQRNAKLRLMQSYFRDVPDPDRGYALAAITRDLEFHSVKPAMLRALVEERMDPVLFAYSYDYVGDMAETISLVWPDKHGANAIPTLSDIVTALKGASRSEGPRLVEHWLDGLDATGRWALIKLVTGGLRIGVSARLAKQALAGFGDKPVEDIEELWHGLEPPYVELFEWLEGKADRPVSSAKALFRPVMLAHPVDEAQDFAKLEPEDFAAEWKWDGIRVQATCEAGVPRLYSRTGDDISAAFPDVIEELTFEGSIDGELLVYRPDPDTDTRSIAPFGDLQQRLNRKTVSRKHLSVFPAMIRAYDLLQDGATDTRPLPFADRRKRLEDFVAGHGSPRIDLSPLVPFEDWTGLDGLRASPPEAVVEGLMLKRWDSIYQTGRPKGPWFKWKRDPFTVDAVLMYAQRGHGKRSSFYSDFTFGVWKPDAEETPELVPVGKAYFGFTDEELKSLDKFVRDNTTDRFGPVRAVRAEPDHGLVLEIAFEGLNRSTRHKSGVAMRFPRISRIRTDKKPRDADTLPTLAALLPA
ncbi:MAG: cisplatin damage response ATP-dependent DNA ligase [Pseudomonadota bacterium]